MIKLKQVSAMMKESSAAASAVLEHAIDGLGEVAMFEAAAMDRHLLALQARWRVARRSRSAAELVRHQLDLLPLTTARLHKDQQQRVTLLRRLRWQVWSGRADSAC